MLERDNSLFSYGYGDHIRRKRGNETILRKHQKVCYEKDRHRNFLDSWLDEFPWVMYDEQLGKMFCTVCRQFPVIADSSSTFLCGNNSFRKQNLQSHDRSAKHLLCEAAKKASSDSLQPSEPLKVQHLQNKDT